MYPSKVKPVNRIFVNEHAKAVSLYNEVIVLFGSPYSEISDVIEDGFRTIRIKYRKSLIPKTTYFFYFWSIYRAFNKLLRKKRKPDIIHAHVFDAGVSAVILGRLYNIPVVNTEHCSISPIRKLTLLSWIKARFSMNRAKKGLSCLA